MSKNPYFSFLVSVSAYMRYCFKPHHIMLPYIFEKKRNNCQLAVSNKHHIHQWKQFIKHKIWSWHRFYFPDKDSVIWGIEQLVLGNAHKVVDSLPCEVPVRSARSPCGCPEGSAGNSADLCCFWRSLLGSCLSFIQCPVCPVWFWCLHLLYLQHWCCRKSKRSYLCLPEDRSPAGWKDCFD